MAVGVVLLAVIVGVVRHAVRKAETVQMSEDDSDQQISRKNGLPGNMANPVYGIADSRSRGWTAEFAAPLGEGYLEVGHNTDNSAPATMQTDADNRAQMTTQNNASVMHTHVARHSPNVTYMMPFASGDDDSDDGGEYEVVDVSRRRQRSPADGRHSHLSRSEPFWLRGRQSA